MSQYPNQELRNLRKSGQVEKAYKRGHELMKQHPNDKYLKSTFGWILYDKIKIIINDVKSDDSGASNRHGQQVHGLFQEYTQLGLTGEDMLSACMDRIFLSYLRKSGQIEKAYKRGKELLRQYPNDKYIKSEFGWVLHAKIKRIIDKAISDGAQGQIRGLFHEYGKLRLDRPDLLFSVITSALLKLPNLPLFFPKFLCWAGMQSFRSEDYQIEKGTKEEETYPSLIERLAGKVGKLVVEHWEEYEHSVLNFALALIDAALNKSQVQEPLWLRYRKGQLLCKMGKQDLAHEHLQYVAKKKQGEFWAWHALADCERTSSPVTALNLCCKAYLVARDKKFVGGVLDDIAQLALEEKNTELAKWAIDRHVRIRQENDWPLPEYITTWTKSDWYVTSEVLKNPEQILKRHAEGVESFLFSEYDWCEANLLEKFTSKRDTQLLKIACKVNNGTSVEVVPAKRFPDFANLKRGTPISVAVESSEERNQIISLKTREDGKPFDCLPEKHGVLDHHNESKSLASIYFTPHEFCTLPYSNFGKVRTWKPGSSVALRCIQEKNRYQAYEAGQVPFQESVWTCRKTDTLRVHEKGFGFVDDIFVPPNLVKDIENGTRVTVVALKKSKKNDPKTLSWVAVSMEEASNPPDSK